ncbi:MAG: hypothetical protein R3B67_05465 [Phycisphaerales bacterium]
MTHAQLTAELVHDLIVEPLPTLDICAKHELNLTQLRQLLESDEFTAIISELDTIDRLRTPVFRRRAINTLETIMLQQPTTPTHAETIRKAAAHYLRSTASTESTPSEPQAAPDPHPESTTNSAATNPESHQHTPQTQTPVPQHEFPPDDSTPTTAIVSACGQPTAHDPPPSHRQSA